MKRESILIDEIDQKAHKEHLPLPQYILPRMLAALLCVAATASADIVAAAAVTNVQTEVIQFNIPAGKLGAALNQLGQQAGISLLFATELMQQKTSAGLQGGFTIEQALAQLLQDSQLQVKVFDGGAYSIEPVAQSSSDMMLQTMHVIGGATTGEQRDQAGNDDVYDRDISTVYSDKEVIERFKGSSAGDMLKGMLGVFSGDSRNGGGLDPSIRGIQGPGRVPVTIDGTEQALTIWRGYRGISNRSYIDPNLVGRMKVIKGPAIMPNVHTSVGGAVVVETIAADDFLEPGDDFAGELKIEGSSNSVDPRFPTSLAGRDFRDVPGFPQQAPSYPYDDPSLRQHMHSNAGNNPLAGKDYAYRIALAKRVGSLDLLAAYAYRKKGNYFSGTEKTEFFSQTGRPPEGFYNKIDPTTLALRHKPGYEVANTSKEMGSWLFKAGLQLDPAQRLELGIRKTDARYGEIMASRTGNINALGMPQWAESKVDSEAYNLKYTLKPDNAYLNLTSNLWATRTFSKTNTAGGFPNYANPANLVGDPLYPGASTILRDTARTDEENLRVGFDISNKMHLTSTLDLTLAGKYQYEHLESKDLAVGGYNSWHQASREGRRTEHQTSFNFNWRPTDALSLNAGMRYSSFGLSDDSLRDRIRAGVEGWSKMHGYNKGHNLQYKTRVDIPAATIAASIASAENQITQYTGWYAALGDAAYRVQFSFLPIPDAEWQAQKRASASVTTIDTQHTVPYYHDGKGKFARHNNPCIAAQKDLDNYVAGSCRAVGGAIGSEVRNREAKKQKGNGWVPALSASLALTENDRIYVRYTEALRFPDMFEGVAGFSASISPYGNPLRPEHAKNSELAYVHTFDQADIKFSYFEHVTEDVIERGGLLRFYNIEKQTIRGLELQGRFDNGDIFTDMSVAYNLENTVCDENLSMLSNPSGTSKNCVHGGFPGGYLADQAAPKYSVNLNIGKRFFNKKMKVGLRVLHVAGSETAEDIKRPDVTTYDAYLKYQVNPDLVLEAVGTNLTNLYYVDPLARSSVPAPGRTLKLSMNFRF